MTSTRLLFAGTALSLVTLATAAPAAEGTAEPLVLAQAAPAEAPAGTDRREQRREERAEERQQRREERVGGQERERPPGDLERGRERAEERRPDAQEPRRERAEERPDRREQRREERAEERQQRREERAGDQGRERPEGDPARGRERAEERRPDAQEPRRERAEERPDRREQRREERAEERQQRREERREERVGGQERGRPPGDLERGRERAEERRPDAPEPRRDRADERQDRREQRREERAEERQQRREERRDDRRLGDGGRERRPDAADVRPERREERAEDRRDVVRERRVEEVTRQRRERVEDGGRRTVIEEPGNRLIVREGNRVVIRHDESDRFRRAYRGADIRTERRGSEEYTVVRQPGGVEIVTVRDADGDLVRRVRRARGVETVLIDNVVRAGNPRRRGVVQTVVELPPPRISIPREKYVVDVERASQADLVETFEAPPVERVERSYTLDEVRQSRSVRERVRSVDIDTITFEFGSWELPEDQVGALTGVATAIRRALERNPDEIFLIEGHTDAVGPDVDNLSLSDRRAEAIADALTDRFGIPAENLTTQGYGEQYLKVSTEGEERRNRRVTVRRITPLLKGNEG